MCGGEEGRGRGDWWIAVGSLEGLKRKVRADGMEAFSRIRYLTVGQMLTDDRRCGAYMARVV